MARNTKILAAVFLATWALSTGASSAFPPGVCNPNQPLSGAQLFADNCASCHGADATGGMASGDARAPDLTVLTRNAKGVFPGPRVADNIRYGGSAPGHVKGPRMAVWAEVFHAECGPTYSRRVVRELTQYIKSVQK